MPWITFFVAKQNTLAPFLLFGFLSLIAFGLNFTLPYDTKGKNLD